MNRLHTRRKNKIRGSMNFPSLFSPVQIGPYQLGHRLVMAPLTRMRAEKPSLAHAIKSLNPLGLAYLHFIEPRSSGAGRAEVNWRNVPSEMVLFRPIWKGILITAGGFTGET